MGCGLFVACLLFFGVVLGGFIILCVFSLKCGVNVGFIDQIVLAFGRPIDLWCLFSASSVRAGLLTQKPRNLDVLSTDASFQEPFGRGAGHWTAVFLGPG